MRRFGLGILAVVLAAGGALGCKATREQYFDTLAKVGYERREILVNRVGEARESQQKAQEEFKDALSEFQALVGYDGGELEKMYNKVSASYEDAKQRADDVNEKIRKVENVGESLFKEWEAELGQYDNAAYRRQSEQDLRDTRRRYAEVVEVMEKAAATMDPVLSKLEDQVLFLKHNLNARALGSLQGTADELQTDITKLIGEMEASIAEADRFIAEMGVKK